MAVDVPDSVKEHLSFIQRSINGFDSNLRFVHPNNFHLTISFLGDKLNPDNVIDNLSSVSFNSFSLRLSGIGFFPSRELPRVLWVGFEENPSLFDLQRKIDLLFTPNKSFKPHLTIARVKKPFQDKDLLAFLRVVDSVSVKPLSFKVKNFKLYKSTLTPLGPIYEVLETFSSFDSKK